MYHLIRFASLLFLCATLGVAGLIGLATYAAAQSLDIGPIGLLTLPLPFGVVPMFGLLAITLGLRDLLLDWEVRA